MNIDERVNTGRDTIWRQFVTVVTEYCKDNNLTAIVYTKEKMGRLDCSVIEWDSTIQERSEYLEYLSLFTCIKCWEELKITYWWLNRQAMPWILPLCDKCFTDGHNN